MKEYRNLTRPELEAELAAVRAEYDALKAKGLQLNMARGKPGKQQLDMVSGLFDVFHTPEDFLSDHLYRYCRETDRLQIFTKFPAVRTAV